MNAPNPSHSLIRKWLHQRLNTSEEEAMKTLLNENDQFTEETANEVVKEYGRIELKNRLNKIHVETINEPDERSDSGWNLGYWAIAATIIVAVPLGYWFFYTAPTPEKLFAQNFQPYQVVNTFRGEEQPIDKGMDLYASGRYAEAIKAMENALANDAYNLPQYYFYLGISCLANNNPDKAINYLQKTLSTDNDFMQQANWYIALAYLKKNDKLQAQKVLQEISTTQGAFKQQEAIAILKCL